MTLSRNEAVFLLFLNWASGTKVLFHSPELQADRVPLRLGFAQLGSLRERPQGGYLDIHITAWYRELEISMAQVGYLAGHV